MSGPAFSLVEMKNLSLSVTTPGRAHDRLAPAVDALRAAIAAVVADMPVSFYVAEKFKKFGEKEQVAALLNALPGFAASGLDPAVAHVALNGERAGLKADAAKLADAAAFVVAHFIDRADGPGAHFDARFSWVPYASLVAVSHPLLRGLVTTHPVTRRSVPFADRYVSMALSDMVSVKELAKGQWNRSELLEVVLTARMRHEGRPLQLPATVGEVRAAALASVSEAVEQVAAKKAA